MTVSRASDPQSLGRLTEGGDPRSKSAGSTPELSSPVAVPLTLLLPSGSDMAHLMAGQWLLLLMWMAECAQSRATRARTELLNVCMDAKHHKEKPGPEDKLHDQVGQG